MIPNEDSRYARDIVDENVKHGIAVAKYRLGDSVDWNDASDTTFWYNDVDWDEVTEIQFADGSIWRLNGSHTPPTLVQTFTNIDTRGVNERSQDSGIE